MALVRVVQVNQEKTRERITAAAGVAGFHALLGYALITGLGIDVAEAVNDPLKVFEVRPEPPPPPAEEPAPPAEKRAPEEEAAPPNLKAEPTPVVAPPPEVRLKVPPPIVAAPVAGVGSAASAGASDRPGPGTGAGGAGTGRGGGGGGLAVRAERIGGRLSSRDYPRRALRARAEGKVNVRYVVGVDGRPSGCSVTRSSGHRELDETTCRLIERRFRYRPARDAAGRPVPQVVTGGHSWWLGRRRDFSHDR